MQKLGLALAFMLGGCATRAPEGHELWVPRGEAARPSGAVDGAQVWVPADASRARAAGSDAVHQAERQAERQAQVDVSTSE